MYENQGVIMLYYVADTYTVFRKNVHLLFFE